MLVRRQLRSPLVSHSSCTAAISAATASARPRGLPPELLAHRRDQRIQRERGIADQRVVGGDILVDVRGIEGRVDDTSCPVGIVTP